MAHTINLFMWGYQPHYRGSLEIFAKRVLADAGAAVEVDALLVGVREPGAEGHPVCVEPEKGASPVELFENIEARVAALIAADPRQNAIYGDAPSMRDKPAWMRATAVRQAVEERLREHDRKRGVRSFVGAATRVEGYRVVPILQIAGRELVRVPTLRRSSREGYSIRTGFLDALIWEILGQAARELEGSEPGRSLTKTFERDSPDVLRAAGRSLMRTPELAADRTGGGLFEGCNQVSALRYEGSAGAGRMVVARVGHPAVHVSLAFRRPVPLRSTTWARKVLQMGSANVELLSDGTSIYGLGRLCDAYDPADEDAFIIDFVGHYTWELRHAEDVLMRVAYDVPRLPSQRITEDEVRTLLRRVFGTDESVDPARVWSLVTGAIEQKHGTLLVVSDRAAEEAARLSAQATPVTPTHLTDELVRRVTGIDGAVLVDTTGRCHAIGVILDGVAVADGDPGRGARFNSAQRYVATAKSRTVALVVSEDGHVNALPTLRPQVGRSEVARRVARLAALAGDVDSDWHKERNWLDEHRFYLDEAQCETVNGALKKLEVNTGSEVGRIWVVVAPFVPDPEMNESYFLPEV